PNPTRSSPSASSSLSPSSPQPSPRKRGEGAGRYALPLASGEREGPVAPATGCASVGACRIAAVSVNRGDGVDAIIRPDRRLGAARRQGGDGEPVAGARRGDRVSGRRGAARGSR